LDAVDARRSLEAQQVPVPMTARHELITRGERSNARGLAGAALVLPLLGSGLVLLKVSF
jgi:hypothetical protein